MLTPKQRRYLRSLAHSLKPVVLTGSAGLTDAVLNEIDQALAHHELIKVKLTGGDRQAREVMMTTICQRTGGDAVQHIGRVSIIYRPASDARIKLPA